MSSKTCVAFDLYGTLLDTASVAKKLSEHLPNHINADAVSTEWRKYQLECVESLLGKVWSSWYTWRLTSMGMYEPFDIVTRKSLEHAVTEAGCHLSEDTIQDIVSSYDQLNVFEDVPETLEKLKRMSDVSTLIFSNGTEKMVRNSIKNCFELKYFSDLVLPFVVVDEVRSYKPSREAYSHLAGKLGKEHALHDVWLISGNPFDIVGARQAGFNAVWVDRKGKGWSDQLGEPMGVVQNLREVIDVISMK